MKKNHILIIGPLFLLLAFVLIACSADVNAQNNVVNTPEPAVPTEKPVEVQPTEVKPTEVQPTYTDPFAYCAAVGTIDSPDARYTGPQVPDEIINGYKVAAGLESSTMPQAMFQQTTIWRCMDSQVYACNFGANLPCSSKANTDKNPTQAMSDYCKTNPDSDFIPMSVTGHSTIYSWHCVKDTPELLDQIEDVDAAGYLSQIWYQISQNANPAEEPTATPVLLGGSGQIVFSSNRGGYYDDLYLLDFTTSQLTRLTRGESNTFAGPFSPDGSKLLFTGFGLTNSYVGVMNVDGTNAVDLSGRNTVDEGFATWSPDGSQIAFTSRMDGNNEIYIMNADGTNLKRITNNSADDFGAAWSPDGTQIAFVSDRNNTPGVNNLYIMNVDGSGVVRLTNGNENDYAPSWSPDGSKIAFRADVEGNGDIYVINVDGSGKVNLTNNPASDWSPAWSPDGSLIAFQTNRDGNWEIYVMNADGSEPRNLTNDPADDQLPYWAPAAQLANPASANCVKVGGMLAMEQRGDLGEMGVCYFEDNLQCEEWALLRGECPVGGRKVTGYITEAGRFCAITGGEYAITGGSNSDNEQGTCTFPNGKTCDAWGYYNGTCSPNQ
jgi:Tol biopolymer transport system component